MRWHSSFGFLGLVGLTIFACSTSQLSSEKLSDPNFATCSGPQATKKFSFTLSSYQKMPAGFPMSGAQRYLDKVQNGYEFAARHWIQRLLQFEFVPGENGKGVTRREIEALGKPMDHECASDSPAGLCNVIAYSGAVVRTGPSNFLLAQESSCAQLIDPVTGRQVVFEQPKESCRPYCHVKGVDDPRFFSNFCENSWFDRETFTSETGFRGWEMVNSTHYYSVPERDKKSVCVQAGLDSTCFTLPTEHDLAAYDKSSNFNTEYPFTNAFLSEKCPNCLHSNYCAAGCNERGVFINALKNDSDLRLQWQSAFDKDLFLKAGTSITKKVQRDWIIYRVEWDPSLFCKYEKPTTDLYTH